MNSINFDSQGGLKTYVADMLCLVKSWHGVKNITTNQSVVTELIDGKIADTKGGQVLEEVSTLTRIDLITIKASLDNDTCPGDVWPLDRDAKPLVTTTPSAWANKHIAVPFVKHNSVYLFYFFCNRRVERRRVAFRLYMHKILNI